MKAAVFCGEEMIDRWYPEPFGAGELETILTKYPDIRCSILSSTRNEPETDAVDQLLRQRVGRHIRFDASVPIPLKNTYGTPATLGSDRLAAAVGAAHHYNGRNLLVVDFGTAITIDAVTATGEYLGGNISPGAQTRFSALHHFTGRLPLLSLTSAGHSTTETEHAATKNEFSPIGSNGTTAGKAGALTDTGHSSSFAEAESGRAQAKHAGAEPTPIAATLTGKNTAEAIMGGVVNGIIFELEGYIARYERKMNDLAVVFTGGDAIFFAEKLKNTIFANYDLTLVGLNRILNYNEARK